MIPFIHNTVLKANSTFCLGINGFELMEFTQYFFLLDSNMDMFMAVVAVLLKILLYAVSTFNIKIPAKVPTLHVRLISWLIYILFSVIALMNLVHRLKIDNSGLDMVFWIFLSVYVLLIDLLETITLIRMVRS
jgi:hypothetical protein